MRKSRLILFAYLPFFIVCMIILFQGTARASEQKISAQANISAMNSIPVQDLILREHKTIQHDATIGADRAIEAALRITDRETYAFNGTYLIRDPRTHTYNYWKLIKHSPDNRIMITDALLHRSI